MNHACGDTARNDSFVYVVGRGLLKKHTSQWNYSEVARHLLKVMTADPAADWRYASAGSVWGRVATAMGRSNTRNMTASVNHVDRKPWQSKLLQHISASHGTEHLPRPSRWAGVMQFVWSSWVVRERKINWQRVYAAENSWLLSLLQKRTAVHHHTPAHIRHAASLFSVSIFHLYGLLSFVINTAVHF